MISIASRLSYLVDIIDYTTNMMSLSDSENIYKRKIYRLHVYCHYLSKITSKSHKLESLSYIENNGYYLRFNERLYNKSRKP